jgi:hypothetical protein
MMSAYFDYDPAFRDWTDDNDDYTAKSPKHDSAQKDRNARREIFQE